MNMNKPTFVYVTYVAATPEQVWEGLTSPEFTRQYWKRAESDWQPGSPVTHWNEDDTVNLQGEVLESDPPHRLVFTFGAASDYGGLEEAPSRVTFTIDTLGGVTRLTVTHDEFPPKSKVYEQIQMGWPAILSNLKSLLETGQPLAFGRWE